MIYAIFGFLIAFGLFVVIPVVAIVSDSKRKSSKDMANAQVDYELINRLKDLESTVANQQKQIADLKELVHINILKMEDATTIQQHIDL
jgi:hypothetical protein